MLNEAFGLPWSTRGLRLQAYGFGLSSSSRMATKTSSRWADDAEDVAMEAQRKRDKEEKRRLKAEKQRKLEEAEINRRQEAAAARAKSTNDTGQDMEGSTGAELGRPIKRRRLSSEPDVKVNGATPAKLLRFPAPEWGPCRHVDNFEKLNHIEEGSYGWVSRARETATAEVVALKKLKMDNANDGFPVTGLREIQTLMESRHPNIVNLREVVMGDSMDE